MGLPILNKRGQTMLDLIIVILFLVAFAVITFFGSKFMGDLNDEFQLSDDNAPEAKAVMNSRTTEYPSLFDNLFMLVLILFWALLLLSAFLVDSHPAFFIVMVLLIILVFVVLMYFGNAFEEISTDPDMASTRDDFPKLIFIMDNLLSTFAVISITSLAALYAKTKT